MTTPGAVTSGGLPVGFTPGNVDIGGQLEANGYFISPSSAQLSGWLAATMDPMTVSAATGSVSVPADDTFVGGLIFLPAPVSSNGMSMFCVASAGTVNHFWGALVSATAGGATVTAAAATADSHASISATTPVHLAWASGPIAVPAGYYYLGYACDWTTDAPTFIGNPLATTYMPSVTTANVVSNLNAQAQNLQWGSGGFRWVSQPSLTLTSSFPALTPANYVAATSLPFIGLY